MASKITQLTEDISPTGDDMMEIVNDPAGTPVSRKVKTLNLLKRLFLADGTQLLITTIADGQFLKRSGSNVTGSALASGDVPTNVKVKPLIFIFDGGGSVIATGIHGDLPVDFNGTIQGVTLLADQSGSIVIDIWKDTYANFPPTGADSITASAKPTISSATKSQDATLTGWTIAVSAGDVLRFNVDSVTSLQRVTLALKVLAT